eukprot:6161797-Prymnesium_polylepis.1
MRGPVGPGNLSNAPGPRWARASVGLTWVGFTGVTGASAIRGPVGPALSAGSLSQKGEARGRRRGCHVARGSVRGRGSCVRAR